VAEDYVRELEIVRVSSGDRSKGEKVSGGGQLNGIGG
jgi:hypothetical protein